MALSFLLPVAWTLVAGFLLVRRYSPYIYDIIIVSMTRTWYAEVIRLLPTNARVLDVGIGTGTSLALNASRCREKGLVWVGVDYDEAYVEKCKNLPNEAAELKGRFSVVCKSVYDRDLPDALRAVSGSADLFDAVYFSGSISLMPDPAGALRAVEPLLKKGGKVYITQTFQRKDVPLMKYVKPLLKYVTTVDFGQLTFEHQVEGIVRDSKVFETESKGLVPGSVDNQFQAAFVLVLRRVE